MSPTEVLQASLAGRRARGEELLTDGEAMAAIEDLLAGADRILVTSHVRPDGDAVGSVLALGEALRLRGKQVQMVFADPLPAVLARLPGAGLIVQRRDIGPHEFDAVFVLECDDVRRSGLRGVAGVPLVNIDHHLTGLAYGSINWVDPSACAVAVLVYRLIRAWELELTPSIATCLYTAVLTDTGAFTYPGTRAETFTLAHDLIQSGAQADTVARDVLYSLPATRMMMLGVALSRLQMESGIAYTWVTVADLEQHGATDEDTEGTANALISIAGIEAALFVREVEREEGEAQQFRVSLRSKSNLDVSAVARTFGGGGHGNAAGCSVQGPLRDVLDQLLLELRAQMRSQNWSSASGACAL